MEVKYHNKDRVCVTVHLDWIDSERLSGLERQKIDKLIGDYSTKFHSVFDNIVQEIKNIGKGPQKELVLSGNRGSGKTSAIVEMVWVDLTCKKNATILVVSPSFRQTKEIYKRVKALGTGLINTDSYEDFDRCSIANGENGTVVEFLPTTRRSCGRYDKAYIDESNSIPEDMIQDVTHKSDQLILVKNKDK